MSESIHKHLSLSYLEARQLKSHTARRQLKLEVVKQFWELSKSQKAEAVQRAASVTEPTHPPELDPDPCDIPNINGSRIIGTRGIVVRTHLDSSDEKAWEAFSLALEGLERDSIANITDTQAEIESESESGTEDEEDAEAPGAQKETAQSTDANDDAEMEEASSSSVPAPFTYEADAIFTIVDPMKPGVTAGLKDRLSAASNIALLRIFNDASIVPVPKLPTDGSRRVKPGHRLIDEDGYQEAYTGARLWVWDQQSAKDQTLRLISPQVFVYGDAIGDSWRARTAHMWDLQLNLDAGMRIDFSGGVGTGWDLNERTRNLKESLNYVS